MYCSPAGSAVKNMPATARDTGLIPGSRRSTGEGNGNPLQYSCLENPMVRGAWQATVHGVTRYRHNLATKPPHQKQQFHFLGPLDTGISCTLFVCARQWDTLHGEHLIGSPLSESQKTCYKPIAHSKHLRNIFCCKPHSSLPGHFQVLMESL